MFIVGIKGRVEPGGGKWIGICVGILNGAG